MADSTAYHGTRSPPPPSRRAAEQVGKGELDVHVKLSRADDFGPLIDEFNRMVGGLKERTILQETFGRHVGEAAAREILSQQSGEIGDQKNVTVMFADLRNFTSLSSNVPAAEIVRMLNLFLTEMVDIVEDHGGMVNKFLGDGFMALFGATDESDSHPDQAIAAGQQIVAAMTRVNERLQVDVHHAGADRTLAIGVGIHTGPAIVGSIGSSKRLEYTAIGDTVNVASRIESLTKQLGVPLLLSDATKQQLCEAIDCREFPPQMVKGKTQSIQVFAPESIV